MNLQSYNEKKLKNSKLNKWIKISETDKSLEDIELMAMTFDIDWACDEVLNDTIDIIENANIESTWFITHNTTLLDRLRANPKFELGIHPNFNPLLEGMQPHGNNCEQVVKKLMTFVPEAKAVRSHSTTQSSQLFEVFKSVGLTYECNHFIPWYLNLELKPWKLWNGLIRVPYFWEDDVSCLYGYKEKMIDLVNQSGLKVFDFHPIHVFLNTESLDRYERTRDIHNKPNELIKYRYKGKGTRTRLIELLNLVDEGSTD